MNISSVTQAIPYDALLEVGGAGDRRNSLRLPLHWPVFMARGGGAYPLPSKTRNVSSNGFYCVVSERLATGEEIECDLVIPTHVSRDGNDVMFLRCKAVVVRVEMMDSGEGFGVACRIDDYSVMHRIAAPARGGAGLM